MSPWIWIVLLVVLLAGVWLVKRRKDDGERGSRTHEALDTLAAWPPEATRVLSSQDRLAHQAVVNALPEYLVLAQVPLARFLKVPRRHSYTEWLTRVGHLCADLLVCDKTTQALAVVVLQAGGSSERAQRRTDRMRRVLLGAKLRVAVWKDGAIPDADKIREALLPPPPPALTGAAARPAPATTAPAIPAGTATVHDDGPDTEPQREPPPSTWFDELESAPTPLDAGKHKAQPPN